MSGFDENSASTLLNVYGDRIRSFLESQGVSGIDGLDRLADVLRDSLGRRAEVSIGFVGESQVGKSTLINAVLDRLALPSGGIGPLTAQATRVEYGVEDRITVQYHGKGSLHRLEFALRQFLRTTGELTRPPADEEEKEDLDQDPAKLDELLSEVAVADESSTDSAATFASSRAHERATYMFQQVRRMMNARAEESRATLLDCVRVLLAREVLVSREAVEPYRARILELQEMLGRNEVVTEATAGGSKAFRLALRERAAGWRSPLVEKLSIDLFSPELEGLKIVDLPGIGVVGDAAAHEAQHFVEAEGDALVIVFPNKGMTEAVAHLLERTGVITKLLFGGRDGVTPIQITIAVTHLDDVARTRFSDLVREAKENDAAAPSRAAIFAQLAGEMEQRVREQLKIALLASSSFESLDGELRGKREQIVDRLCAEMSVICVAAPDYLELRFEPDSGLSFLRRVEDTGVPTLRIRLRELARNHGDQRRADCERAYRTLLETIDAHLSNVRRSNEDGRGIAIERWEQFTDELRRFAEPLQLEMRALHGEVAGTLRGSLLERIQTICGDAENQGLRRLKLLRRKAQEMHYQSLNAALRRDGVWDVRGFNFPEDLTRSMVDAVATSWEPQIIEAVRAEIRRLAELDLKFVEQLVQKARELDSKIAEGRPIEEQKKILQQNSRSAVSWTKEQLEDLRNTVQEKLRQAISKPIEKACQEAVHAGRNLYSGAKLRIIEVFEDGGSVALTEARKEAKRVLETAYKKLLAKLEQGYLREFHDPVQAALDTLTDQVGARARRADAKKRREALDAIAELEGALSGLQPATGEQAA